MSTDPINMQPAFQTKDKKGFIRSVSMIFYSESAGFLFCDEMRKGFPNPAIRTLENHMIGGKCDLGDSSPIISGFREFIEEVGFPTGGVPIETFAIQMANRLVDCRTVKWDQCVSVKKALWNRFYVIGLDTGSDLDLISELYEFTSHWKKQPKLPLESIYWWKPADGLVKPSSLLLSFVNNLPPKELLI